MVVANPNLQNTRTRGGRDRGGTMKRCTIALELPRVGTEFTLKMPAYGVVRRTFFDERMPNVLLIKKDDSPQVDLVPMVIVEFSPDETWLERRFVVASVGVVVDCHGFDVQFVDVMAHPIAGLMTLYEVRRPGNACFGCAAPEGVAHAGICPVAHPKPDAPALQIVEPVATELPGEGEVAS
jgi:hypothetical protein